MRDILGFVGLTVWFIWVVFTFVSGMIGAGLTADYLSPPVADDPGYGFLAYILIPFVATFMTIAAWWEAD